MRTGLATLWMSHGRIELQADGSRQTLAGRVTCTRARDGEGRAFPALEVDVLEHLPRLPHGSLRREILEHWWAGVEARLEGVTDLVVVATPAVSPILPRELRRVAAASRCRLLVLHHDFCLVAAALQRQPALLAEPRFVLRDGARPRWTEVRCGRGAPTRVRIAGVTRQAPARLPVVELDGAPADDGRDLIVDAVLGAPSLVGGLRFSLDSTAVIRSHGAPRPLACFTESESGRGRLLSILDAPSMLELHTGLGVHPADHGYAGTVRLPAGTAPPTLLVAAARQRWLVGLPEGDDATQGPFDVLSLVA